MPKIQNRYKTVRKIFPDTAYGKLEVELAVGETTVLVKDAMGIKATLPTDVVKDSDNTLINACRESDEAKFEELIKKLGA
jgi:hypothetical protein